MRRGDERSRELSTSWDMCRTSVYVEQSAMCCTDQEKLDVYTWQVFGYCCCLHEITHSQTVRILNWTSPCQTQTRPSHPFVFFPRARFDRSHQQKHSEPV